MIAVAGLTMLIACFGNVVIEITSTKGDHVAMSSKILCLDVICDVMQTMLLPLGLLLYPYIRIFQDISSREDPFISNEFINGGRIATITSVFDFLVRIYPLYYVHYGLDACEQNWKDAIRQKKQQKTTTKTSPTVLDENYNQVQEDRASRYFTRFKRWVMLPFLAIWMLGAGATSVITMSVNHCTTFPFNKHCLVKSYPLSFDLEPCSCLRLEFRCEEIEAEANWTSSQSRAFLEENGASVQNLLFAKCAFDTLPTSVLTSKRITHLYLEDMTIKNLEIQYQGSNLRILHVFNSRIISLPDRLSPNLLAVDIEGADLPNEIPFLKNYEDSPRLGAIVLKSNPRLKTIPPAIFNYPLLEGLIIRNSSIHTLPPEIGNMKQLLMLHLSQNQIKSIPEEIKALTKLYQVELEWNQITSVPWRAAEIEAKNINQAGRSAGNMFYNYFSLASNPICEADHPLQIHSSKACEKPCGVGCPRLEFETPSCYIPCNTSACNYDNGACLN